MLLDRPVTLSMFILALVIFGGLALGQLRMDFLPSVAYPSLTIRTGWQGATAEIIEKEVTMVIEAHLGALAGIQQIRSLSTEGLSHIQLEFTWGQSMDIVYLNVREKLDQLRSQLPPQVERPELYRYNPADAPIAEIMVYPEPTSAKVTPPGFSLNRWTDQVLCRQLEQVDGIAFTELIATAEPELHIEVDLPKMTQHQLELATLRQTLASYLKTAPTGEIRDGGYRYTLTIKQTLQEVEQLREMPIKRLASGQILTLKELARVEWVEPVQARFILKGEREVSTVLVKKDTDADQTQVQEQMHVVLNRLRTEYPGVRIEVIKDTASVVRYVIQNLHFTLWMGALCSFLILYVFLNDPQLPLVIGISIPLCLLTTFLAMYLLDLQLNVISMSGLILGVGLFVDNGIVVLEHVHNLHKEGLAIRQAIVEGLRRVAGPVMASTLTTISVYAPLLLLPGAEGVWFRDQAWTLTLSLLSSWAITMLILPGLVLFRSQRLMSRPTATASQAWFSDAVEQARVRYETMLQQVLRLPTRHSLTIMGLLLLLSWGLYQRLPKVLLPEMTSETLNLHVSLPAYYDASSVREAAHQSLQLLKAYAPDSLIIIRSDDDAQRGNQASKPLRPGLRIQLPNFWHQDSGALRANALDLLLERFRQQHREWKVSLDPSANRTWEWFEAESHPVQVYLVGDDRKALLETSRQVATRLKTYRQTITLELAQPDQVWTYRMQLDPEGMERYRLQEADLVDGLQTQGAGVIQTLELDQKETLVRWLTPSYGSSILDFKIPSSYGEIPLSQLAQLTPEHHSMGLERVRQASVLSLNTNLTVRDWFFEEQTLRDHLNTLSRELGVPIMVEGAAMEIKAMMHRMGYLLLLSVILIYVILAVQFEHVIYPLIVLFSIPCAWFGGLLALWLGQGSLNILSFLSALLLSGLAVNDAILKVDVVKHCLNSTSFNSPSINIPSIKNPSEMAPSITHALAESGRLRFRPVIMTTVTTVLGLIPLLIPTGMGYEFRKPFGLILIGGMISSTVLTLFLIPLWCKWAYQWGLLKPTNQRNTRVISPHTTCN